MLLKWVDNMTDYQLVEQKLENFPDFRERAFRTKYLAILALRKCGLEERWKKMNPIDLLELSDFAIAYDSMRHAWTDVTKEREDLRGNDWEDKTTLCQKKQIELGYEPNYYQDTKSLQ